MQYLSACSDSLLFLFESISNSQMSEKKEIKRNTNCCVPQCNSKASKNPEISFHQFPVEEDYKTVARRKEWLLRLRIGKKVSRRMVVCSKHFRKDDFFAGSGKEGKVRVRPRLKKTAVPTLCLPVSSTERKEALERKQKAAQDRPKQKKNADNLKKKPGGKRKKIQSKEITPDEVGNSPVKCLSNQTSSCFNLDEKDKSECIPAVSVKVEEPWEKESIFTPKPVGDNSQVCDKLQNHFEESQFESHIEGPKKLRRDAVPTIFDVRNPPPSLTEKRKKGIGCHKPKSILDKKGNEKENSDSNTDLVKKIEALEKENKMLKEQIKERDLKLSSFLSKEQIEIKEVRSVSNSFSAEGADENKTEISETSSHFARPLKVLKREKIFGALVASELSDLSVNPELYLKTKRAILDILNQARFELINCDS